MTKRVYDAAAYDPDIPIQSYWEDSVDLDKSAYPALARDTKTDVAIIGAGFTGLNAGLQLAEKYQGDVTILEAGWPGWGASGRNAGFACYGGTKRSVESLVKIFGLEQTQQFVNEQIRAIEGVRDNLERYAIDADTHSNGEIYLAHRPKYFQKMIEEAEFLRTNFGVNATLIRKQELPAHGVAGPEFHGAMIMPDRFALNPLKYSLGLAAAATKAGITIHGHSKVTAITRNGQGYQLHTSGGTVFARRLIIATNGYSSDDIPLWFKGKFLPVFSSIIVTRPMSDDELAAQGWTSELMAADSRRLLHYFRLMPNRRFLFGMRGGLSASPASEAARRQKVRKDFERMFPAWREVEDTHFWSGLVCLTRGLTPYVGAVPGWPDAWASFAYHGAGVALGGYCGRWIADMAMGALAPDGISAIMRKKPRPFPLPFLRTTYLKAAYAGYGMLDEWL